MMFIVAGMAELVDAIDSKSIVRKGVRVRVPLPAQHKVIKKCQKTSFI